MFEDLATVIDVFLAPQNIVPGCSLFYAQNYTNIYFIKLLGTQKPLVNRLKWPVNKLNEFTASTYQNDTLKNTATFITSCHFLGFLKVRSSRTAVNYIHPTFVKGLLTFTSTLIYPFENTAVFTWTIGDLVNTQNDERILVLFHVGPYDLLEKDTILISSILIIRSFNAYLKNVDSCSWSTLFSVSDSLHLKVAIILVHTTKSYRIKGPYLLFNIVVS